MIIKSHENALKWKRIFWAVFADYLFIHRKNFSRVRAARGLITQTKKLISQNSHLDSLAIGIQRNLCVFADDTNN